jgi:hypothetical protein
MDFDLLRLPSMTIAVALRPFDSSGVAVLHECRNTLTPVLRTVSKITLSSYMIAHAFATLMASMPAYVDLLSFDGTAHASRIVERRVFSCDPDREPARLSSARGQPDVHIANPGHHLARERVGNVDHVVK